MNQIKKMDVSNAEKILLLREIRITDKTPGCFACAAKKQVAIRLLEKMVEFEVSKLRDKGD